MSHCIWCGIQLMLKNYLLDSLFFVTFRYPLGSDVQYRTYMSTPHARGLVLTPMHARIVFLIHSAHNCVFVAVYLGTSVPLLHQAKAEAFLIDSLTLHFTFQNWLSNIHKHLTCIFKKNFIRTSNQQHIKHHFKCTHFIQVHACNSWIF